MFSIFKRKVDKAALDVSGYNSDNYRQLLNEHLGYISNVCERAASDSQSFCGASSLAGEGGASYLIQSGSTMDADELFVQVVDHLKEDDFRRLRDFQGRSSITTYLTTIISRLVVDMVRQRKGRSRAKERSETHGELGRHVYELMIKFGHKAEEASDILMTNFNLKVTADELMSIHGNLLGRDNRHQSCADMETAWGEGGEFVVIQGKTPEAELIGHSQNVRRCDALSELIEGLSGEEQLLLRLRFPLDEETSPLDMEQISDAVGLTVQQVDRKLRRILISCRETLLSKGLRLEELL